MAPIARKGKNAMPSASTRSAFTLLEILIIVVILGAVIVVAAPMWMRAREISHSWTCQEHLVRIDEAKEQWALTSRMDESRDIRWEHLLSPDGPLGEKPVCPAGGTYTLHPIGEPCQCDYIIPDWLEPQYRHMPPALGRQGAR